MPGRGAALFAAFALLLAHTVSYAMLGAPHGAAVDEHTQAVAAFAVDSLATRANFAKQGALSLSKVVSAQKQVVAGVNHILVLELKDEAGPKTVEVTVWEKLPSSVKANDAPMELTNFKLVGPAAEANEQWTHAAQQGIAQLNQRANSLFPYSLLEVLTATPAADGSQHTVLLVAVKRGDKHETFSLTVRPSADNHYSLVSYVQQQQQQQERQAGGPATS